MGRFPSIFRALIRPFRRDESKPRDTEETVARAARRNDPEASDKDA